jgi:hypothetical protein
MLNGPETVGGDGGLVGGIEVGGIAADATGVGITTGVSVGGGNSRMTTRSVAVRPVTKSVTVTVIVTSSSTSTDGGVRY